MTDGIGALWSEARDWAQSLQESGWLGGAELERFDGIGRSSAADLFDSEKHRPLVIAFFGGTGVGKSSLLNRLAGADIARTGVERPTSREVTLFVHRSMHLRQLPDGFPAGKARIATHDNLAYRQVLWIDMPDIDSVELANRELVLAWLPHIDVLIYVVSPERYRDDQGWRLLRSERRSHAWLFVINQWDMGHPAQREDFAALLQQGGFRDPQIFCTDCRPAGVRRPDEFDRVSDCIGGIANQHVIEQLADHIDRSRLTALGDVVAACLERLGSDALFQQLREQWDAIWSDARSMLLQGLEWPAQRVAQAFVKGAGTAPAGRDEAADARASEAGDESLLWDAWADRVWHNALDRLVLQADAMGLPVQPLRGALATVRPGASELMSDRVQTYLRHALARPGDPLRRALLPVAAAACWALPLLAAGWVAFRVVIGYYESIADGRFLGTDFAIHSGMLVLVAWLLPWAAKRALSPSAARAAEKGVRHGMHRALAELSQIVDEALGRIARDVAGHRRRGEELLERAKSVRKVKFDDALERLLAGEKAVEET